MVATLDARATENVVTLDVLQASETTHAEAPIDMITTRMNRSSTTNPAACRANFVKLNTQHRTLR
jgi:hypothetical protein